jgi:hypothetical protein
LRSVGSARGYARKELAAALMPEIVPDDAVKSQQHIFVLHQGVVLGDVSLVLVTSSTESRRFSFLDCGRGPELSSAKLSHRLLSK